MKQRDEEKPVLMDFTGAYRGQGDPGLPEEGKWILCGDISGTNCYCDREAEQELVKRIASFSPCGIHYLDSGNYHYMSKLWTDKLQEPFDLLVFDHHTDMQQPAFGDILSCGGWIKEALDRNSFLRQVWIAGPPEASIRQTMEEAGDWPYEGRVRWLSEENLADFTQWFKESVDNPRPFYISVDKDVLAPEYACTSWDQGTVSLKSLEACLKEAMEQVIVVGMDVCGEDSEGAFSEKERASNRFTNLRLHQLFKQRLNIEGLDKN